MVGRRAEVADVRARAREVEQMTTRPVGRDVAEDPARAVVNDLGDRCRQADVAETLDGLAGRRVVDRAEPVERIVISRKAPPVASRRACRSDF